MKIEGSVALVTGANRGLGLAYARALVERHAEKVYAAARDLTTVTEPGVVPLALDITDPEQIQRAAEQCGDVNLLINSAGVMLNSALVGAPTLDAARFEMEVNFFGTLAMCRAFAPVLGANGGGVLVNMLSVLSWFAIPMKGSYAASKSAAWAMTNGVRIELAAQGTLVVGVHAGFIDTDMVADVKAPKIAPAEVVRQVCIAIEAESVEVIADERSRNIKAALPGDHELIYPAIQADWDSAMMSTD